jgi:hypothetical protein
MVMEMGRKEKGEREKERDEETEKRRDEEISRYFKFFLDIGRFYINNL